MEPYYRINLIVEYSAIHPDNHQGGSGMPYTDVFSLQVDPSALCIDEIWDKAQNRLKEIFNDPQCDYLAQIVSVKMNRFSL